MIQARAEFNGIDAEIIREAFDWFHAMCNSYDGSDSWYETSCKSLDEYEVCEGANWNWKDKGYVTVLDLLQVKS